MKIAILDKHVLFAESLQQLLIRKSDVVDPYIYQSVESLIEHAHDKFFDMMIVDRTFLGKDENALINYLRSRYPAEMAIVILVETDDSEGSDKISLSKVTGKRIYHYSFIKERVSVKMDTLLNFILWNEPLTQKLTVKIRCRVQVQ